jgi:hypothetical protein
MPAVEGARERFDARAGGAKAAGKTAGTWKAARNRQAHCRKGKAKLGIEQVAFDRSGYSITAA